MIDKQSAGVLCVLSAVVGLWLGAALVMGLAFHPSTVIERGWFEHKGGVYRIVPAEVK